MTRQTEQHIKDRSEVITAAAYVLIGMVRVTERSEGGRSTHSELEFTVDLTGGGVETWVIRIERTASSH
jgi:hypothetical protein